MNETTGTTFRTLLATDDSDAARHAEAWVSRGRWQVPCVIDVMCVARHSITRLGWDMHTDSSGIREAVDQLRESELLAAEQIANEVGLRLQGVGLNTRARVRQGDVATEILATIEVERPDLVVVGPRGRSGLAELLLGSVSRRIIAETTRPVLVARGPQQEHGTLPQTILVLVDGTPVAEAAIDWLGAVGWTQDAEVTLLGLLGVTAGVEFDDPELVSQITRSLRNDAVSTLDGLVEKVAQQGCEVAVEVESGHPHESTLRVAERLRPDVIVVARPGGGRGHPLAEKVARYAKTSVLVVPGS